MTSTPWGEAGELQERRLRPGPGVPREEVERNQRERLFGATVAVTTEAGYGATRVADLIEVAGVSRATFYSFYTNKEECFLATLDELIGAAVAATSTPVRETGSWEERAQGAIAVFTDLLVRQPASARFCLVESFAVGPAALERVDAALAGFEQLLAEVMNQAPGAHTEMPPELSAAFVGGLRKMVHTRLHRHTEHELVELLPAVLGMALAAYRPPPEPFPTRKGPAPADREAEPEAGPIERIHRGTLAVVAERGFAETAITDVAAAGSVSLSTFYAHFDGKQSALDGAVEGARDRLVAAASPAVSGAPSWPEGICRSAEATLAFFESEPDFAKVMAFDIFGAGPDALEQLDLTIEATRPFLDGGYEIAPQADTVAREAIPTCFYALIADRVRSSGVEGLTELTPFAAYLVLAPFLGPDESCAVIRAAG